MSSKVHASTSTKQTPISPFVGLSNRGGENFCYLNATLQMLMNFPSIRQLLTVTGEKYLAKEEEEGMKKKKEAAALAEKKAPSPIIIDAEDKEEDAPKKKNVNKRQEKVITVAAKVSHCGNETIEVVDEDSKAEQEAVKEQPQELPEGAEKRKAGRPPRKSTNTEAADGTNASGATSPTTTATKQQTDSTSKVIENQANEFLFTSALEALGSVAAKYERKLREQMPTGDAKNNTVKSPTATAAAGKTNSGETVSAESVRQLLAQVGYGNNYAKGEMNDPSEAFEHLIELLHNEICPKRKPQEEFEAFPTTASIVKKEIDLLEPCCLLGVQFQSRHLGQYQCCVEDCEQREQVKEELTSVFTTSVAIWPLLHYDRLGVTENRFPQYPRVTGKLALPFIKKEREKEAVARKAEESLKKSPITEEEWMPQELVDEAMIITPTKNNEKENHAAKNSDLKPAAATAVATQPNKKVDQNFSLQICSTFGHEDYRPCTMCGESALLKFTRVELPRDYLVLHLGWHVHQPSEADIAGLLCHVIQDVFPLDTMFPTSTCLKQKQKKEGENPKNKSNSSQRYGVITSIVCLRRAHYVTFLRSDTCQAGVESLLREFSGDDNSSKKEEKGKKNSKSKKNSKTIEEDGNTSEDSRSLWHQLYATQQKTHSSSNGAKSRSKQPQSEKKEEKVVKVEEGEEESKKDIEEDDDDDDDVKLMAHIEGVCVVDKTHHSSHPHHNTLEEEEKEKVIEGSKKKAEDGKGEDENITATAPCWWILNDSRKPYCLGSHWMDVVKYILVNNWAPTVMGCHVVETKETLYPSERPTYSQLYELCKNVTIDDPAVDSPVTTLHKQAASLSAPMDTGGMKQTSLLDYKANSSMNFSGYKNPIQFNGVVTREQGRIQEAYEVLGDEFSLPLVEHACRIKLTVEEAINYIFALNDREKKRIEFEAGKPSPRRYESHVQLDEGDEFLALLEKGENKETQKVGGSNINMVGAGRVPRVLHNTSSTGITKANAKLPQFFREVKDITPNVEKGESARLPVGAGISHDQKGSHIYKPTQTLRQQQCLDRRGRVTAPLTELDGHMFTLFISPEAGQSNTIVEQLKTIGAEVVSQSAGMFRKKVSDASTPYYYFLVTTEDYLRVKAEKGDIPPHIAEWLSVSANMNNHVIQMDYIQDCLTCRSNHQSIVKKDEIRTLYKFPVNTIVELLEVNNKAKEKKNEKKLQQGGNKQTGTKNTRASRAKATGISTSSLRKEEAESTKMDGLRLGHEWAVDEDDVPVHVIAEIAAQQSLKESGKRQKKGQEEVLVLEEEQVGNGTLDEPVVLSSKVVSPMAASPSRKAPIKRSPTAKAASPKPCSKKSSASPKGGKTSNNNANEKQKQKGKNTKRKKKESDEDTEYDSSETDDASSSSDEQYSTSSSSVSSFCSSGSDPSVGQKRKRKEAALPLRQKKAGEKNVAKERGKVTSEKTEKGTKEKPGADDVIEVEDDEN